VRLGGNTWGRVSYVWISCVIGLPARAVNRERKLLFKEHFGGAQALSEDRFPVLAASLRQTVGTSREKHSPCALFGCGANIEAGVVVCPHAASVHVRLGRWPLAVLWGPGSLRGHSLFHFVDVDAYSSVVR